MGHRENMRGYAEKLLVADGLIGRIRSALTPEDVLVVQADHGNDPTIGHPHHTREYVPLLVAHEGTSPGFIGTRPTLADVGATVADYFGASMPQSGTSFLGRIMS